MSDHKVILSPRSKERALYMLEQNKLEFYVSRTASKHDIRGSNPFSLPSGSEQGQHPNYQRG